MTKSHHETYHQAVNDCLHAASISNDGTEYRHISHRLLDTQPSGTESPGANIFTHEDLREAGADESHPLMKYGRF